MLTDAERAALKRDYPNHYFTRLVGYGVSAILATPKRDDDPAVSSMPGITLSMLHGATMKIGGKA